MGIKQSNFNFPDEIMISVYSNTLSKDLNSVLNTFKMPEFKNLYALFYSSESVLNNKEESGIKHLNALSINKNRTPVIDLEEVKRLKIMQKPYNEIFDFFHAKGSTQVCLKIGNIGALFSQKGKNVICLSESKEQDLCSSEDLANMVWSGFIFTNLNQKPYDNQLEIDRKLQKTGKLFNKINSLMVI